MQAQMNFKFGENILHHACNWHPVFGQKSQKSRS